MEFPSPLRKSFKSHGSSRHSRKVSVGSIEEDIRDEQQQPILSEHQRRQSVELSSFAAIDQISPMRIPSVDVLADHREVIVDIDSRDHRRGDRSMDVSNVNGNPTSRQSQSFEFQRDRLAAMEDPPSKLIGQFLSKQRAAGGEMSLDMDLEVKELHQVDHHADLDPANTRVPTSKELKVSFQDPSSPMSIAEISKDQKFRRENSEDSSGEMDDDITHNCHHRRRSSYAKLRNGNFNSGKVLDDHDSQVVKCTSFQRRGSTLGRMKTKSRLMDPPEIANSERRSGKIGKSSPMPSGLLARASGMITKPAEDEEDDPLFDEDLPEEYRKGTLNALTLAQWISLILLITALVCTLAISDVWRKKKLRGLNLWKWEVLGLVLVCGRLVSGWVIKIAVFFIERNFLLRKRVLYFVYGVRRAVQNCIWLGLVLIAWRLMFDKKVEGNNKFLRVVNKLMVCMLVGTLLWLFKTLMVKVLASSFHVSTFFDRIQESLFNQYVIEMLSGPPLIEIQQTQEEEERTMAEVQKLQNAGATIPPDLRASAFQSSINNKSGKVIGSGGGLPPRPSGGVSFKVSGAMTTKNQDDQGISIDQLHKLNQENISAWNMKRLMKIVRHGFLSTLDEQILGSTEEDENTMQIRSEYEAKAAARKIFRNVAKPRSKFIYMEDLMRFLREDEAARTVNLMEGSSDSEKISRGSLKSWVVNVFRERRALALTLNDTKTAVITLHRMVNVVVAIIILVICVVILGIASTKFLLFVSSQVVVVAFIFGNTCKTVFEAIIFLFVMHPFDVGDRCEIDGVQMVVEEMNILTTVFLRYDNQKIIFPNSTLATRPISNYYRSPDMGDSIEFAVHIATPEDKIALMKQRMISFIESKKDHWYSPASVVHMNIEDLNRVKLSVWIRHKMNHQDMGEKWLRRAVLVEELVKICQELDIEHRLYPLDINIRTMPTPVTSNRLPPSWTSTSEK